MSSTSDGDESEAIVDSLESTNLRSLDITVVPWDVVLDSRLNTHQSRGPGFSTRSWNSSIDVTAIDEDLLATLDQLLVDWQHASSVRGVVGVNVQAADSPGDVLANVKSSLDFGVVQPDGSLVSVSAWWDESRSVDVASTTTVASAEEDILGDKTICSDESWSLGETVADDVVDVDVVEDIVHVCEQVLAFIGGVVRVASSIDLRVVL